MMRRLVLAMVFLLPGSLQAAENRVVPASQQLIQLSYAPVVRKAAPAVVNIYSPQTPATGTSSMLSSDPAYRRYLGDDADRAQNSLGSGVIVNPNGTIVTNAHLLRGAEQIIVVLSDRREFDATIVRVDDHADLAVIKINTGGEALPFLDIRDSDELEVGDIVLAIGNPFGVGQTVTNGIVSALGRNVPGINDYRTFIQTDAAINPGNSGGALVSLDGRLIGINTALYSEGGGSVGIGFAIPTALVRNVLADTGTAGQPIIRPWLGANGRSVTAAIARRVGLAKPAGTLIDEVIPDSPAAAGGLAVGDVVMSVDGKPVEDEAAMRFRFATRPIGATARLAIWRAGDTREIVVKLEAPPETPRRDVTLLKGGSVLAGVTVGNLSPALADELQVDAVSGVIVLDVPKGSPAHRLKLRVSDVLEAVNGQPMSSAAQVQQFLARQPPLQPLYLAVRRDGRLLRLTGP